MSIRTAGRDGATRREYVKRGGVVVSGASLADCTGDRADALADVHDSMRSTIESKLPPADERRFERQHVSDIVTEDI